MAQKQAYCKPVWMTQPNKAILAITVSLWLSAVNAMPNDSSNVTATVNPNVITNATWTPTGQEQSTTAVSESKSSSSTLRTTVLFLCFLMLIVAGASCCVYSICGRWKFKVSESGIIPSNRWSRRSRRARRADSGFFREDLLDDDEILRLWVCWYCDFANYEMKTHCALCGHQKRDKRLSGAAGDEKNPSTRPTTLTSMSVASTAMSPSRGSSVGSASFTNNAMDASTTLQTLEEALASPPSPVFFFASSPSLDMSYALGQTPPSPSPLTSTPMLVCTPRSQRRKEWLPTLNDKNELVWKRHASIDGPAPVVASSSTPNSVAIIASGGATSPLPSVSTTVRASPASAPSTTRSVPAVDTLMDEIVNATAFVGRNDVSSEHPHGRITISPADQAPAYPPFQPIPLFAGRPSQQMARASYEVEDRLSAGMDPFALDSLRAMLFPEKHRWFMQETTSMLNVRWPSPPPTSPPRIGRAGGAFSNDMVLLASRQDLVHSAVSGLMSVSKDQLRHRPLRVQFAGEPGIDAGGVVREWFALAVEAFLDENTGLFQRVHSPIDGLSFAVNPNVKAKAPGSDDVEYYLLQYRAFGRLLGKALLEGHLVPAPLSDTLFKLMLGTPLSFADLAAQDPTVAHNLQQLWETELPSEAHEVENDAYGLDFSVYHPSTGVVDLKPGGRDILVREGNKREYVSLFVQWQLALSSREEVGALVSGMHDVLPAHMLAPFDYQELRLLLCGSPAAIDMDDWEEHSTLVVAKKCPYQRAARVARWFWRVLREEMGAEERERLLQFATGCARVPVLGFRSLTASDGRVCPFTLHVLPRAECASPRAFTCFNRLDLPAFRSEQELRAALELIVRADVTGFSIQ